MTTAPQTRDSGKNCYRKLDESTWYYQFQVDGQSYHGPCIGANGPCTTKKQAEKFAADKKLKAKGEAAERKAKGTQIVNFGDAIAAWLRHKLAAKAKETDLDFQTTWLAAQIGRDTPLHKIDNDMAFAVREAAQLCTRPDGGGLRRPLANSTVHRRLRVLRAILNLARKRRAQVQLIDWGGHDGVMHKLLSKKKPSREIKINEQLDMEAAMRPDYRNVFRFYLATGLRAREVLSLKGGDVDLLNREFTVVTKGDKTRVIKLTLETEAILREESAHMPDPHGPVFTYVTRNTRLNRHSGRREIRGQRVPICYTALASAFKTVFRNAGLMVQDENGRWKMKPQARIHAFRHTFGTRMRRAGVPLSEIKDAMGHASIRTTDEFYQHVEPDDVVTAATVLAEWQERKRAEVEAARAVAAGEAAGKVVKLRTLGHADLTPTVMRVPGKVAGRDENVA